MRTLLGGRLAYIQLVAKRTAMARMEAEARGEALEAQLISVSGSGDVG